jgi:ATP-dependent Lhr-like helicase
VIARRQHLLLVAPTGTGKTLAAFMAILDRLLLEHVAGGLSEGLRCVYVSPLRSLGYDIERNLAEPLEAIRRDLDLRQSPVRVGVRTGDTSPHARRRQRERPPHLLITTPESLALLLSQAAWTDAWRSVEHLIVDEVHALVPTKRGADLAVSLERLSAATARDPVRSGLSATCKPVETVARFLVGANRPCEVVEAHVPRRPRIRVESLLRPDEAPHRGLTYARLLHRLRAEMQIRRTTVIFANTRALTEKITHDLRRAPALPDAVGAHHSALDAARRREVEAALRTGALRAVVTSTSLELGVDIGTADSTVMVGPPGSVSSCLQRVGRSGHRMGARPRGVILGATPAEIAGAAVVARAAGDAQIEPVRCITAPLDVLCQQLIGMACAGDCSDDAAYRLVRRSAPMESLRRDDFDACLAFLAGIEPCWTTPRLWWSDGRFGLRHRRVARWLRRNIGTIHSEESFRVLVRGVAIGTLEGSYAERLQPGDRFVLDGRTLEFERFDGVFVRAAAMAGQGALPRWSSDRQSLSPALAGAVAEFRARAASLVPDATAFSAWLAGDYGLGDAAVELLAALVTAQQQCSEVPGTNVLLVEESPHPEGWSYAFHVPLCRSACEALGHCMAARLGRRFGRDLALRVADLGWSLRVPPDARITLDDLPALADGDHFDADVLEGVDRGELLASRFRRVAATGLMVLDNPDHGRTRVGGMMWVSRRLYPLVNLNAPDHPLLRETRREVLEDLLDTRGALEWLAGQPAVRLRRLGAPSPFTVSWIDPADPESLAYEAPETALHRLHRRLLATIHESSCEH